MNVLRLKSWQFSFFFLDLGQRRWGGPDEYRKDPRTALLECLTAIPDRLTRTPNAGIRNNDNTHNQQSPTDSFSDKLISRFETVVDKPSFNVRLTSFIIYYLLWFIRE